MGPFIDQAPTSDPSADAGQSAGLARALASRRDAAVTLAVALARPMVHLAVDPPFLPRQVRPVAWPGLAERILDHVDLTGLIKRTVDLDALVSDVDIDAIASRIELAALVNRLDIGELTAEVLDAVDLAEIFRESTGVAGSEAVRGVRMQGIRADEAVDRVVNRLLHLRSSAAAATAEPTPAQAST